MNTVTMYRNAGRMEVEGQFELSAAGAVGTVRGDGVSVVKNGTGLYDITVTNPAGVKLYKELYSGAELKDAAVGTVKDVGVKSLSQSSTNDSFTMTVRTVDAAGADVDEATNALTVSFSFVIQTTALSQTTA
jgi:hypothetical protein